jgi:phosphoglycolate phosphatase
MPPSPALVFDLDGTLVDTAPDILAALNAVLHGEGMRPMDRSDIDQLVGHGARAMLAEALARAGGAPLPARTEELTDAFIAHYRAHLADESRPYPGVASTLAKLVAQGARLGVLTNKPQELADQLLEQLGLARYFIAIHGAGRYSYSKPDARVFHHVVEELGGPGMGAIMIGDSTTDALTARAAGVPLILLTYGYTPDPVETLNADAVTGDFTDLPHLVARILDTVARR